MPVGPDGAGLAGASVVVAGACVEPAPAPDVADMAGALANAGDGAAAGTGAAAADGLAVAGRRARSVTAGGGCVVVGLSVVAGATWSAAC